ncbi:MAG TPA: DNA primase small subunit PriS [Thermoplasmata archaeon]|nr:DNA primase small subunit PriS [Thermoplasmata archaeon]
MAKTVPLDAATLAWARGRFADYYATARLDPPSRLARREFAAFPFAEATMMRRHATLRTPEEFAEFLRREVPRHVYYSTAYYQRPAAPNMAAKEWMGADLIFDLDSDHLRGAEQLDYAGQLALVKARLLQLFDDFLTLDFDVERSTASIVFSGGRGYHVHIRDDRFLQLTSPDRRELVDYIMGVGVDAAAAIEHRRESVEAGRTLGAVDGEDGGGPGRRAPARPIPHLCPRDAPGWRGRVSRSIRDRFARWGADGYDASLPEMRAYGLAPGQARRVVDGMWRRVAEDGALDVFPKTPPDDFFEHIVRSAAVPVQGETDAPVTTDIHRLIRLPNSLHGGTGLRVVPLDRAEVEAFDPFADAVTDRPGRVPVEFRADVDYPFPGGLRGHPGGTDELPTPQAVFLVLRGEAVPRPSPG